MLYFTRKEYADIIVFVSPSGSIYAQLFNDLYAVFSNERVLCELISVVKNIGNDPIIKETADDKLVSVHKIAAEELSAANSIKMCITAQLPLIPDVCSFIMRQLINLLCENSKHIMRIASDNEIALLKHESDIRTSYTLAEMFGKLSSKQSIYEQMMIFWRTDLPIKVRAIIGVNLLKI
jgi:hypothetical protein